jgi:hypothetical protein
MRWKFACLGIGFLALAVGWPVTAAGAGEGVASPAYTLERVSTAVPFPRGLVLVGDELIVLARGRVRSSGGVSAAVEDRAGTLFVVDTGIGQVWSAGVGPVAAVQGNGRVLAEPTSPPFLLWDRTSNPPQADTRTDRPYCVLRYDEPTNSLYVCAFSGVDLDRKTSPVPFSKNLTDGVLRFDLGSGKWSEIERHDARTPHYPSADRPPHGHLKGPNNLTIVGRTLYAAAKDNSVVAAYDLRDVERGREYPRSAVVLTESVMMRDGTVQTHLGPSALAERDGYLYVGYRTSGTVVRFKHGGGGLGLLGTKRVPGELVARFTPFDPVTRVSADITDMAFDRDGRLVVLSAEPARLYRFWPGGGTVDGERPDGERVFDAVGKPHLAYVDLAAHTGNPRMKSENLMIDPQGRMYVTSGDGYSYQAGAEGTVYRITPVGHDGPLGTQHGTN